MLKHLISISALVVVASGACFDNGDKEIGGACYKFVAQKLSFADARNWCHYQNPVTASYLASVSNQFTANFLASYARSAFGQNDGYFWIGLSRNKTYTPWTWDTGYQMQWSNFDSDQLSYNYAAENIVNSKWRTFAAEEQMNFVCSYDPTSPPTFAPPTSDGPSTPTPTPTAPQTTTQTVPTTTDAPYCQFPPWPSTFLLAYSRQLPVDLYENVVQIVTDVLTNYPNQDNVLRDAFLDDKDDEVVRQPKDYQTFFSDISNNRPNPTPSQTLPSNAVTIIENFIPTAQETSEYSGKTTNWLENSILLLLPVYVSPEDDLTAENYTSFINRNVKVFIVLSTELLSAQGGSKDLSTFSRIAARTNGHLITVGSGDYGRVVSEVMRFGYGQDLLFTRNIGRAASGQRVTGSLRTPQSTSDLINVTITITEEIGSNAPGLPSMLYLQFESVGGSIKVDFLERDNAIHNSSNFYSATIPLLPELEYIITVAYQPFYNDTTDLLIRMWKDRETYQYAEFVDLDIYPTNPDDKEGAALRMTVINDCYQQSNADIWISDCTGLETQKFDVEQRTGLPIITESSFPKFAFVPYFCDAMPVGGSACVQGAEGKYDVQLTVGTYSITRSFECLAGSEPTKCTKQDGNGNYYCTRDTVPYKRGPTGQLTDCSPHGFSQFDAVDTQDYVCICDKGYSGVSCEKTG